MSSGIKTDIIWRRKTGKSVRSIARSLGITVPALHQICGCLSGHECDGRGCRIR